MTSYCEEDDDKLQRWLFLQSVVPQGSGVTVRRHHGHAPSLIPTKSPRQQSSGVPSTSRRRDDALSSFLLSIAREWGNPHARCYHNRRKADGAQHLSFANVLVCHDGHSHKTNHNVYCIVNTRPERDGITFTWGCHNDPCPVYKQMYTLSKRIHSEKK